MSKHHQPKAVRCATSSALLALSFCALCGCAINPATGERQLALIGEAREVEMGQEAAEQVKAQIGVYDDPALQRYVDSIGQRLAAASERPDLPWQFAVVDDPAVNAFALPGGAIFLTRGILAHFDSEAELATVLGHEIGHVTGRHSVEQMSKAQLSQLGLNLGAIFSPSVRAMQGVLGTGLQLLLLKHSRDAEREADRLGLRYMVQSNYEPTEALDVFTMLDRQRGESNGQGLPDWLSTHPPPGDRRATLLALIGELPATAVAARVERDTYLRHIDGLQYGTDPRQGFVRGNHFIHPTLGFEFTFPTGWQLNNLPDAVQLAAPDGTSAAVLTITGHDSASTAAEGFYGQSGVQAGDVSRTRINGLAAIVGRFNAQSQGGRLAGVATHLELDGRVYQLLGFGAEQHFSRVAEALSDMFGSFSRLDAGTPVPQPKRIDVITTPAATTLAQLRESRGSALDAEQLALLNGVTTSEILPAGRKIKWIAPATR